MTFSPKIIEMGLGQVEAKIVIFGKNSLTLGLKIGTWLPFF